jgi:HSP20 family protein
MKRMEEFGKDLYLPDIEVVEKDGAMIVRADLPGIKKEDVTIEITNNSLVIRGERRTEEKEERNGYYRSERSYGSFCRNILHSVTVSRRMMQTRRSRMACSK